MKKSRAAVKPSGPMHPAAEGSTTRLSAELVEAARLLSKREVLSAHDLDRVKALSSPPPSYTPERVAKIRIYMAKVSQSV